ncbi:hypothetical protein [Sinomonas sp. G460-2]|uniref:hypothetical protein n=1 Tax=Sinomonas sp. G460-2 TaxID=3393464 RepID=UPI0039F0608C
MSIQLFPDNTVLINFAYLHRMDLLRKLAKNPAWCATVAHECNESSQEPDLEDLVEANDIFGEPLRPDSGAEHVAIQTYRTKIARPGDAPYKNYGEAETLAIIESRSMRGIFVTDDKGVARAIQEQPDNGLQVSIVTTWELLRVAARRGFVDRDTLWSYVHVLRNKGRHQPPCALNREAFERWLDET